MSSKNYSITKPDDVRALIERFKAESHLGHRPEGPYWYIPISPELVTYLMEGEFHTADGDTAKLTGGYVTEHDWGRAEFTPTFTRTYRQ